MRFSSAPTFQSFNYTGLKFSAGHIVLDDDLVRPPAEEPELQLSSARSTRIVTGALGTIAGGLTAGAQFIDAYIGKHPQFIPWESVFDGLSIPGGLATGILGYMALSAHKQIKSIQRQYPQAKGRLDK